MNVDPADFDQPEPLFHLGPRIGSLFSCVGGLDLAVLGVLGGEVVWHAEIDPAGCKVLAHRWPGVPNLGDVSSVDWSTVPSVDVLVGGFPCTDVSLAGKGAGLTPDTRSGLWAQMALAVAALRPRLVVIENVRGLLSARAHSDMEPCPWCLGDDPDEPALRALGAVLGDLAELGCDAEWVGVPASDSGACHQRFRVFVLAWPRVDSDTAGVGCGPAWWDDGVRAAGLVPCAAADADSVGPVRDRSTWGWRGGSPHDDFAPTHPPSDGRNEGRTWANGDRGWPEPASRGGAAADAAGPGRRSLLPVDVGEHGSAPVRPGETEPRRRDRAAADADGERLARWSERHGEPVGLRQPASLGDDAHGRVLATPTDWGIYSPAIRRWEHVIGRPAPAPTVTGARGGQQLSARFVEWMQGLPEGWVTDVPGVSRNDALRLLGGMVVPQQGAAALRELLCRAGFVESLDGAA